MRPITVVPLMLKCHLQWPVENRVYTILSWNPQGKRRRGPPAQTWSCSYLAELQDVDVTWMAAKKTAQNRIMLKTLVLDLCSAGK